MLNRESVLELDAMFQGELDGARDIAAVDALKQKYLGKTSALKQALKSLGTIPGDQRPDAARLLNDAKTRIEGAIEAHKRRLVEQADRDRLHTEWVDLSMPGLAAPERGALHPVTVIERRCLAVLRQLGFRLVEGPEVEWPFYNFDALNIPKQHPARDMQDTFFVTGGLVLRSHTTSVQARVLEQRPPLPIKVASAGRVYRNEAVDATHLAMFHQLEGFWLDRGLNFAHLKGVLRFVAQALYGEERRVRFKPKYYPYTEPSVGMDLECTTCRGRGCGACHGAGWVTIIGAGMIHRNVLRTFGYDPDEVTGLAFGWGTSRMVSQWVGLPRVKSLYEQDVRLFKALHRDEGL